MRVVGRRPGVTETGDPLIDGVAYVLAVFPEAKVLGPERAQAIVDGPPVDLNRIKVNEARGRSERRREYVELRTAALSLARRRKQLFDEIGKRVGKRTYYVMQCQECEGMFLGTAGAKGWKYPSGRKGSCSTCTAGMNSKAAAIVTEGAIVLEEVRA